MRYKGYTGVVEFDESANVLFGRVIGLRDVITFQGESVAEVTQAFHDSVDVYLEFCEQRGKSPEKPYSGKFVLRLEPELHRTITQAAEVQNISLNALVESTLEKAFDSSRSERALTHNQFKSPSAKTLIKAGRIAASGNASSSGRSDPIPPTVKKRVSADTKKMAAAKGQKASRRSDKSGK
jgi:predicted HicB family RNase H-like nuclease